MVAGSEPQKEADTTATSEADHFDIETMLGLCIGELDRRGFAIAAAHAQLALDAFRSKPPLEVGE